MPQPERRPVLEFSNSPVVTSNNHHRSNTITPTNAALAGVNINTVMSQKVVSSGANENLIHGGTYQSYQVPTIVASPDVTASLKTTGLERAFN